MGGKRNQLRFYDPESNFTRIKVVTDEEAATPPLCCCCKCCDAAVRDQDCTVG